MEFYESIGLISFALALIYAVAFFFAFARVLKIHSFNNDWHQAKYFYVSVVIVTFLRTSFFLVIFIRIEFLTFKGLFLLLSIPEIVIIVCYILLAWQYLEIFSRAYIRNLEESLISKECDKQSRVKRSRLVGVTGILFWCLSQLSVYIAYLFSALEAIQVVEDISFTNLALSCSALSLMLCLNLKFSGDLTHSVAWENRLKKMGSVMMIWSIARCVRGVIGMVQSYTDLAVSFEQIQDSSDFTLSIILTMSYLIGTEVICFFFVFDYNFIGIFLFSSSDTTTEPQQDEQIVDITDTQATIHFQVQSFSYAPLDRRLKESELQILEDIQNGKGELGVKFKAGYLGRTVLYRKLNFSRLSGYVVEELSDEIARMPSYDCPHYLPTIGVIVEIPKLGIVTPYMPDGSLFQAIHGPTPRLTLAQKLRVMKNVAQCFKTLHAKKLYHGHLTSHNVLLDEQLIGYVSDYGLHKVKKYAGLMLGYTNKSAWSSPEQLKERSLTVLKATPYDDVYSFGIILWEVVTGQVPFPGYSRKQLSQKIGLENYRPQIPEQSDLPEALTELIKSCWNTEPQHRPNFDLVFNTISDNQV